MLKVSDWEPSTDLLYEILEEIEPFAKKNGISITKPDRYRAGRHQLWQLLKMLLQLTMKEI